MSTMQRYQALRCNGTQAYSYLPTVLYYLSLPFGAALLYYHCCYTLLYLL